MPGRKSFKKSKSLRKRNRSKKRFSGGSMDFTSSYVTNLINRLNEMETSIEGLGQRLDNRINGLDNRIDDIEQRLNRYDTYVGMLRNIFITRI